MVESGAIVWAAGTDTGATPDLYQVRIARGAVSGNFILWITTPSGALHAIGCKSYLDASCKAQREVDLLRDADAAEGKARRAAHG